MIGLLVSILVAVLVCGAGVWGVGLLPLSAPYQQAARGLLALILLCWILAIFGVLGGPGWRIHLR